MNVKDIYLKQMSIFKQYIKILNETGYLGGPSSIDGAATFRGGPYGFGGDLQLAAELTPSVKRLKKQRDKEAVFNIEDQMGINRGYPAPQSITGYPGGESRSGIRSGVRIPNSLNQIAFSAETIDDLYPTNYKDDYWGYNKTYEEDDASDEMVEYDFDLVEALGSGGGFQGPQRGVASDQNYRDLQGYPRHNAIEKQIDFVPPVTNDKDNDGEEDEYLSDAEYVNDVLRLNGIEDLSPEYKEKLKNNIRENKLSERTLYHGTINDHYHDIKEFGLTGKLGDFVESSYGIEFNEDEFEEKLGGITFAADKKEIDKAVGAMRWHISRKLNKTLMEVDEDDLLKYGMLVIIRDVDEPKKIKYSDDIEEDEWYRRSTDENDYGEYPISVEPGDWFYKSDRGVIIDDILTGKKMLQVLRRMGGLKHVETAMRRRLINLVQKAHITIPKNKIIDKIKSLPKHNLQSYINKYENILSGQEDINEMYVSPSYGPEPNKGIERYKQGRKIEGPQHDLDKIIINRVDYVGGHTNMPAAEISPGAQTYGNVAFPKDFVPEDWEQRNWKTKSIDDKRLSNENIIYNCIKDIFDEAFTGIDGDENDEPKGGSEAFEKSREEVLDINKKNK